MTMRRRTALMLPFAFAAPPAEAAGTAIGIDNFVFTPDQITVPRGTTVVWTNHDDIPHSVVDAARPPGFKSPVLDTDEAFTRQFDTPGHHDYFCSLHPHMKGVVIVT